MIPKGNDTQEFEDVVVYSRITNNLMEMDFNNRVNEVHVGGGCFMKWKGCLCLNFMTSSLKIFQEKSMKK